MELKNKYITRLDKKEEYKRLYEHALKKHKDIHQITHIDKGIICTIHSNPTLRILYKLEYAIDRITIVEKRYDFNQLI